MKQRIRVDAGLLAAVILFTAVLYQFPRLYPPSRFLDNSLDWLGLMAIFAGAYIRMAARGVKKARSRRGDGLVTDGLYSVVRNPMYFGSLMMGAGFVLIVCPVWFLPVFAGIFYLRFRAQIIREERSLAQRFGEDYAAYCRAVPRMFPRRSAFASMNAAALFPWKETWSTKEGRGLPYWSLAAVPMESLQEWRVFGSTNVFQTAGIFLSAALVFLIWLGIRYRDQQKHA